MVSRRPLVLASGLLSELPPGDTVVGADVTVGTLTAGSGLSGGGNLSSNQRVDVSLVANPSGIIFVGNQLGLDGAAQRTADTALSSGNAALSLGSIALASGNAGLSLASTALASGNAALTSADTKLPLSGGIMTGSITFVAGQVYPQVPANSQTTAYVLAKSDAGKHISITTGGVTVPSGIFAVGDAVSIYNNSVSNQTITQGASVTLRQVGTANTGNRTLAQYGLVTILCVATDTFVVSGGGLS